MRVTPVRLLLGALLIVAVAGLTAAPKSAQVEATAPDATHRDVRQLSRPRPAPEAESTSRPPQPPPLFFFIESILDALYFLESAFMWIVCFIEGFFGPPTMMCTPCTGAVIFGPLRKC